MIDNSLCVLKDTDYGLRLPTDFLPSALLICRNTTGAGGSLSCSRILPDLHILPDQNSGTIIAQKHSVIGVI